MQSLFDTYRDSYLFFKDLFGTMPQEVGLIISLIVPIFVIWMLYHSVKVFWLHYVQQNFITGMDFALLEVRIPRNVYKTPLAMELILTNSMYQHTRKSTYEIWWQGAVRFWYSLEMVSLGGRVHFYIRTPTKTKDLVETQIYAQYPQADVIEVEDYTRRIPARLGGSDYDLWGCEFGLKEHDALPIRTYVDYGLDKPGLKPHEVVDPITPTLEFLASCKPDEQIWIQVLIRASAKLYRVPGKAEGREFPEETNAEIMRLMKPYRKVSQNPDAGDGTAIEYRVPDYLKGKIDGMGRKTQKLPFDVGIRCIYIAKKQHYDKQTQRALRTVFRQYGNDDTNSFERNYSTGYPIPWLDPLGVITESMKERTLRQYRLRSFFNPKFENSFQYPKLIRNFFPSYYGKPFVLNVEEIATIFHFPSRSTETPGIERVESRRAEPPVNLPT